VRRLLLGRANRIPAARGNHRQRPGHSLLRNIYRSKRPVVLARAKRQARSRVPEHGRVAPGLRCCRAGSQNPICLVPRPFPSPVKSRRRDWLLCAQIPPRRHVRLLSDAGRRPRGERPAVRPPRSTLWSSHAPARTNTVSAQYTRALAALPGRADLTGRPTGRGSGNQRFRSSGIRALFARSPKHLRKAANPGRTLSLPPQDPASENRTNSRIAAAANHRRRLTRRPASHGPPRRWQQVCRCPTGVSWTDPRTAAPPWPGCG
jgi:hypothetical protein